MLVVNRNEVRVVDRNERENNPPGDGPPVE